MLCLLVASTGFEIAPVLKKYRENQLNLPAGMTLDILITGIGLMSTTYALTRQIQLRKPDIIIQAGIAGSFDKSIPLGTVVAVKKETVADLGVVEGNTLKTVFHLGLSRPGQFPFSKGWLINRSETLKKSGLPLVTGISVNEITTSSRKIKMYEERFRPVTESMEGAALHYTALMENVPFVQIRALSNFTGERNKARWELKKSITNLNNEVDKFIRTLNR